MTPRRGSRTGPCRIAVVVAVAALAPASAGAQTSWLTGYLQTVPLFSGDTELTDGNASDFSRIRLTTTPALGSLSFEAAYEQTLSLQRRDVSAGFGLGAVPGGGEWLDLQWTLTRRDHVEWRHRFDRLSVAWSPAERAVLSAGRQAVSWGTTLFLTPADPFLPFSPADPFRQFRGGVDAARLRLYPSPLSEIDIVVRPSATPVGDELTALGRGLTTWRNWELSGWGGSLYGDLAGAFGVAGALGAWAVRGEGVLREADDRVVFRGTAGVDRAFQVAGRDLFLVVEYQRDNLAAADPEAYLALIQTDGFRRGELQVIGRDEAAVQASYQLHPLWSLAGLALWNVSDGSVLVAPSVAYSAGDETSISGGVYVGTGDRTVTPTRPLPSEYGLAGTTGFVSVSWFF